VPSGTTAWAIIISVLPEHSHVSHYVMVNSQLLRSVKGLFRFHVGDAFTESASTTKRKRPFALQTLRAVSVKLLNFSLIRNAKIESALNFLNKLFLKFQFLILMFIALLIKGLTFKAVYIIVKF
jgi:hypothetical protein